MSLKYESLDDSDIRYYLPDAKILTYKELAKVKTPVKSQRRANKKQTALRIEDFVSKVKAKDQVTQLLE